MWSQATQLKAPQRDLKPTLPITSCSSFLQTLLTSSTSRVPHASAKRQAVVRCESQRPASSQAQGSCYGCGAALQTSVPEAAGYVEPERYQQKLSYRQLNQLLCGRCRLLSHGNMVPGVEDSWVKRQTQRGKPLATPEQLRQQLAGIREQRALIVLLVDLLDASGSMLSRVRDLTGANPVVVIGTKADLLPKGADPTEVTSWLADMAFAKKLNAIHTCILSSRTGDGVPEAAAFIRQNRLGRSVYIVGAANVGKSAFSRALVSEMSNMMSRQFDPAAANVGRRLPVASPMPGTTLQLIPLRAFHTGGQLIDTPGLHLHHRIPHLLAPEEAKALHPRGRLSTFVPPMPTDLTPPPAISLSREEQVSASYAWGGLARIDVLAAPRSCVLTFYTPSSVSVSARPLQSSSGGDKDEGGQSSFGAGSVQAVGGLQLAREAAVKGRGRLAPLTDIAISGLPGWVTVASAGQETVHLQIWAPVGVEAFLRPPLPCPNPAVEAQWA